MREKDGGAAREKGKGGKIAAVAEANPLKQGLKLTSSIVACSVGCEVAEANPLKQGLKQCSETVSRIVKVWSQRLIH